MVNFCKVYLFEHKRIKPAVIRTSEGNVTNLAHLKPVISVGIPVFVQPYALKPLTLYQIETIPVPILDMNKRADSYTWLRIDKPYIALNLDTYISI